MIYDHIACAHLALDLSSLCSGAVSRRMLELLRGYLLELLAVSHSGARHTRAHIEPIGYDVKVALGAMILA